jgi:hypothetical protein
MPLRHRLRGLYSVLGRQTEMVAMSPTSFYADPKVTVGRAGVGATS